MASDSAPAAGSEWEGGELLFAGVTDWARAGGRAGGKKQKKTPAEIQEDEERALHYPNQYGPVRLKTLQGVKVKWIAAGPAACHSVIGDAEGRCWTWGRNELRVACWGAMPPAFDHSSINLQLPVQKGQLGHGDLRQRNVPTLVAALKGHTSVAGAGGKNHSAVVTSAGDSWAFGLNSSGQLGTGSIKNKGKGAEDLVLAPAKAAVSGATAVAAGMDFTVWLCGGRAWSAGNPQFGQLGHGTDHEYNASDFVMGATTRLSLGAFAASVKIVYDPQPTPQQIAGLAGAVITRLACGHNHTVAVDSDGMAYTWGNGGYGRLGQNVQKDEFAPKRLEPLASRIKALPDGVVAAGSTSSFCTCTGGMLFGWGKLKSSGDNWMYPRPFDGLSGWTIHAMAAGSQHFAVAAEYQDERSTITWGQANYGELGYGANGKKSSANPGKVDSLEGVKTQQVACGVSHTLFLVDADEKQLEPFEVFEPETTIEDEPKPTVKHVPNALVTGKRKAGALVGPPKSKK